MTTGTSHTLDVSRPESLASTLVSWLARLISVYSTGWVALHKPGTLSHWADHQMGDEQSRPSDALAERFKVEPTEPNQTDNPVNP